MPSQSGGESSTIMDLCIECHESVKNENLLNAESIKCSICKQFVHYECIDMPEETLVYVNQNKNMSWTCNNCISDRDFQYNVLYRLKTIESVLETHTSEISIQKLAMSEIKSIIPKLNVSKFNDNKNATPKRKWSDIVNMNTPDLNDSPYSPAKVFKNDKPLNNYEKRSNKLNRPPVLVIKPVSENDKIEIKNNIKKTVNPQYDPVKFMSETKKGNVILTCEDHSAVQKIKEKLSEKIGQNYLIEEPKESKPVMCVINISEFCDEESLLSDIRKQNKDVISVESEIEVVNVTKRNKTHTAYIRTDTNTFKKIMQKQKLYIQWNRCRVFESFNVRRSH